MNYDYLLIRQPVQRVLFERWILGLLKGTRELVGQLGKALRALQRPLRVVWKQVSGVSGLELWALEGKLGRGGASVEVAVEQDLGSEQILKSQ